MNHHGGFAYLADERFADRSRRIEPGQRLDLTHDPITPVPQSIAQVSPDRGGCHKARQLREDFSHRLGPVDRVLKTSATLKLALEGHGGLCKDVAIDPRPRLVERRTV